MFYYFPHIRHISDVLPYIVGVPEFIVSEKEYFTIISYVLAGVETFPPITDHASMIRRECRGLIFDKDGWIISRRYHKFFNVNERPDVAFENVDLSRPHIILEKLDGSMVTPVPVNIVRDGEGNRISFDIRWATKMGITDTSMQAEVFVASRPQYAELARWAINTNVTLIFEWCSNKNRIILDYPEDQLVLTAIRNNLTGEYPSYKTLKYIGQQQKIPVVKALEVSLLREGNLLETIAEWEDTEGIVIRFDNGHMLKVKCEWYVLRHRSKDMITREYVVIDMLVNSGADDISSFLSPEDKKKMDAFAQQFHANLMNNAGDLTEMFEAAKSSVDNNRKRFALEIVPEWSRAYHPVLWQMFDGADALTAMKNMIKKNLKASRIDNVRDLFSGETPLKWEYTYESDMQ